MEAVAQWQHFQINFYSKHANTHSDMEQQSTLSRLRRSALRKTLWSKTTVYALKQLPLFIIYGYAFLFMYTGYDKLQNVHSFINGIKRIPFVGQYAELIGKGIPTLEILLAILLILPFQRTQRAALWLSTGLMGIFTLYLALMLLLAEKLLCHCGGVIESMGWTQHLVFNVLWLGAGIWTAKSKIKF